MPKILATMLGHVVLQTLLVLWLAQNTLQGGTIHQGGGGVGKMLMPSRGAGVPLGMQGGHGHGAKPSKTGGGYGGAGGKHMKQGYISWPVYGAALGMGIGRGLGPQAAKPRGGYGGNGFGYGGQAFGGYRPGASTYLRPGFGFGAGAGTGYPNVGGVKAGKPGYGAGAGIGYPNGGGAKAAKPGNGAGAGVFTGQGAKPNGNGAGAGMPNGQGAKPNGYNAGTGYPHGGGAKATKPGLWQNS